MRTQTELQQRLALADLKQTTKHYWTVCTEPIPGMENYGKNRRHHMLFGGFWFWLIVGSFYLMWWMLVLLYVLVVLAVRVAVALIFSVTYLIALGLFKIDERLKARKS